MSGLLLLVCTWTVGDALAATAYRCTDASGRTTYSDQPCTEGERGDEVKLRGQPLIGGPDAQDEPVDEGDPGATGQVQAGDEAAAEAPEIEDVRAPRLRRLNALYGLLLDELNAAAGDCGQASNSIISWITRHGAEVRELSAAWDEIRFEKLNLKQKELEAMRARFNAQLSRLRSVTLPTLNAKCWNDRNLGVAFDQLQPYLPGS